MPAARSHPAVPRFSVAERCRFKGWHDNTAKAREWIRRTASGILYGRHEEGPDIIGGTSFWYAHQIACLDGAIDRVRAEVDAGRGCSPRRASWHPVEFQTIQSRLTG